MRPKSKLGPSHDKPGMERIAFPSMHGEHKCCGMLTADVWEAQGQPRPWEILGQI